MATSGSVPTAMARTFAVTGAALFAAALLYFLFTYVVTFGETSSPSSTRRAIVLDTALFAAFAVHHSLFARQRVRAWVTRVAGPLERSLYVWVASILLIAVCAAWAPLPGAAWRLRGPAAWGLLAIQLSGVWLTLRSAAIIDVFDLAGVRVHPPGPAEFKTIGPYGWVRHPIYAGWFLLVWAVPAMTTTRLLFATVSCLYLLVAIPLEERTLRGTTAGAYDTYVRQVRWKLVPGVFLWWVAAAIYSSSSSSS